MYIYERKVDSRRPRRNWRLDFKTTKFKCHLVAVGTKGKNQWDIIKFVLKNPDRMKVLFSVSVSFCEGTQRPSCKVRGWTTVGAEVRLFRKVPAEGPLRVAVPWFPGKPHRERPVLPRHCGLLGENIHGKCEVLAPRPGPSRAPAVCL